MDIIGASQNMGNTYITSNDGEHIKDHQGNGHDFGGFMNMMCHMLINPRLTKEGHEQSPEHIERRHPSGKSCDGPQQPMTVKAGKSLPENFIFAEEAGQPGNARNGQRGKEESPEGIGDLFSETSHLSH